MPDDALAALADTIFPATDGLGAASELGAVDYVRAWLAGPAGHGENRYAAAPYVVPDHGGHGWQWPDTPAEAIAHLLAVLDDAAPARSFATSSEAERESLLTAVDDGRLGDPLAAAAFALVRTVVLEGVLGHPRHGGNAGGAAWLWIGHPGATT